MKGYFNDDPYCDYDWDNDGFPSEYVYGDCYYVDDYYMDERWKPIYDFPGYWVSNKGRVYSNISERFVEGSPNVRTGRIDISLQRNGVRYHRYLHRLMAEAFVPNPHNYPIVRHLDDDPANNCIDNLLWGTQVDNMRDSIRNGTFRYFSEEDHERAMLKRRMPIIAIRFSDGERLYFESQQEASRCLQVNQSDIYSVINGKYNGSKGYYFTKANEPFDYEAFEYAKKHYVKQRPLIKAFNTHTGETYVFKGLTEAANILGVNISAISTILHGKAAISKGWTFEYIEKGDHHNGYY